MPRDYRKLIKYKNKKIRLTGTLQLVHELHSHYPKYDPSIFFDCEGYEYFSNAILHSSNKEKIINYVKINDNKSRKNLFYVCSDIHIYGRFTKTVTIQQEPVLEDNKSYLQFQIDFIEKIS